MTNTTELRRMPTAATFYAGIGSRETPDDILVIMTEIAESLANRDYVLRSGMAVGADAAFQKGAVQAKGKLDLYTAKDATQEAIALASQYHPAWYKCSDYAKKLLGRNSQIILGCNLNSPVNFVICWTPNAAIVGGTAIGIKIAMSRGIKVYNLANQETYNFMTTTFRK